MSYSQTTLQSMYHYIVNETLDEITLLGNPKAEYKFEDFHQDVLDIESEIVEEEFLEHYENEMYNGYSEFTSIMALDYEFHNFKTWYYDLQDQAQMEANVEEEAEERYMKAIVSRIENAFLNAKYNPRTPLGKKFVESLYDENF